MVRCLRILIGTLRSSIRTHHELALENLALRQQLAVWEGEPAAATADGPGPDLLGLSIEVVDDVAAVAAPGAA